MPTTHETPDNQPQTTKVLNCIVLLMIAGIFSLPLFAAEPVSDSTGPARQALSVFNGLIGEWRGTGQVRRGSAQGAWRETGEFVWDFSNGQAAVLYNVKDGKLITSGRVTWNPATTRYDLLLVTADGKTVTSSGIWEKNQIVFTSEADTDRVRYRTTITALNDQRTLVLQEKTAPGAQAFSRLGEVGYTREGTHLADSTAIQRECVVTGGAGTMTVSYKGATYYVCCSGCRQAFDENPEQILAEYRERVAKRKTSGPSRMN